LKSGKPLAKGQVVVVPIGQEGFFYELKSGVVGALAGTAVWKGGKALIKNGGKLYSFIVGKNGKVVMTEVDEAAVKASSELKELNLQLFGGYNKGEDINLSRFTETSKVNGKNVLMDPKTKQYIMKDKGKNSGVGGHGGSAWKLFNKSNERIGTISEDGRWLRK
jgi:hypothetical protein